MIWLLIFFWINLSILLAIVIAGIIETRDRR